MNDELLYKEHEKNAIEGQKQKYRKKIVFLEKQLTENAKNYESLEKDYEALQKEMHLEKEEQKKPFKKNGSWQKKIKQ